MTALDEFEQLRNVQMDMEESGETVPTMDALMMCELLSVLKYNPVLDRISVLEERYNELKEHYNTLYLSMKLHTDIIRSLMEKVDILKKYIEDTNRVHTEQVIKVLTKQTEHEGTLASHKRAIDEMKESITHIFHIIR